MSLQIVDSTTDATRGDFILVHGDGGLGKSTFALGAPDALLFSCEGGEDKLIQRGAAKPKRIRFGTVAGSNQSLFVPRDWNSALLTIDALQGLGAKRPGQWLVIDGATRLWDLCADFACKSNGWKSLGQPGYGKGERAAYDEFRKFAVAIDEILRQGTGVVMTSHSALAKDPQPSSAVDDPKRWVPAFCSMQNADMSGYLYGMADVVLYMNRETFTAKVNERKFVSTGDGRIVARTRRGNGYMAKCRYAGVDDPVELSDAPSESWERFWSQTRETEAEIRAQIDSLLPKLAEEKRAAASAAASRPNASIATLKSIRDHALKLSTGEQ